MTARGSFDPTTFVADKHATWPPSPGGSLMDDDTEILTDDEGETLTTTEPWYRPGDTWRVTAAGTFQGVGVRPGGRLVVLS